MDVLGLKNFWVTDFHAGTTINKQHRKDIWSRRFGENLSSRCSAIASKKEKNTERPVKCKMSPSLAASEKKKTQNGH